MLDTARVGPWIALVDGRPWYPLDPRPEEVSVEVIAHHLSNICRYSGATKFHLPVAQHAVLLCRWLRDEGHGPMEQMCALHHDDPEGLTGFGDVVRPMKHLFPQVSEIEDNIWLKAIAPKFGLPAELPFIVTRADIHICGDEKEQALNPPVIPWKHDPTPIGVDILKWSPEESRAAYLQEHYRLVEEMANG